MSEKQKLISDMLEMQKKFIRHEQTNGVDSEEYYNPEEGSDLDGYQAKYNEMANRLLELAHAEKGSRR